MKEMKLNLNWWTFMLNGLIAVIYGLFALLVPAETLGVVVKWTGILIIVAGVIMTIVAISRIKKHLPFKMLLVDAILLIVLGIIALIWTKQIISFMIFIIGLWAAIIGASQLFTLINLKGMANKGFFIFSGILSLLFGILLIINPFGSAQVFVVISGIAALVFGIIMMMFSLNVRKTEKLFNESTLDE